MGKVNAALVATLLANRFGCRAIVFSGVAGVIEGERLTTYQEGHVPFINPTERLGYSVDPALLGRARTRLRDVALPPLSREAGGRGRAPQIA
jgi:adenosylhomocysteine nucleosidase